MTSLGLKISARLFILLLATGGMTGCAGSPAPTAGAAPETRQICIDANQRRVFLNVELAATRLQRQRGLMYRQFLPEDAGMLFVFDSDQPARHAFWMYRTKIPLDIAYLDKNGTIVAIRAMDPCTAARRENCPLYPAGAGYRYALEVNQGFFNAHRIQTGDTVLLDCAASNRRDTWK